MASIQHRTGQQVYRCQNASHTALDLQSHRSTCAKAVGLTYSSISKQECQRERDMHTSCLHHTVLSRSRHQHLCQDARASPCRFWTIHSPLSLPFSNLPTEEKKKEKKKKVFLFISPFFFSSLFHCLLTGTTYAIPKHFHSLLRPVFRWEMGGIYKHLYLSLYQSLHGKKLFHLPSTGHENTCKYYTSHSQSLGPSIYFSQAGRVCKYLSLELNCWSELVLQTWHPPIPRIFKCFVHIWSLLLLTDDQNSTIIYFEAGKGRRCGFLKLRSSPIWTGCMHEQMQSFEVNLCQFLTKTKFNPSADTACLETNVLFVLLCYHPFL